MHIYRFSVKNQVKQRFIFLGYIHSLVNVCPDLYQQTYQFSL